MSYIDLLNKLEDEGYCQVDRIAFMSFEAVKENPTNEGIMEDVFNQETEDICEAFNIPCTEDHKQMIDEAIDDGEVVSLLYKFFNRTGFIAQINTPVFEFAKNSDGLLSNGATFTWGYTYLNWIYGETIEDLTNKAIEVSQKLYKDQKDKFMMENEITHEVED